MKTCSKCKLTKSDAEYYVKDSSTGRLHAQCKTCYKEHRKTTYPEHYAKYGDHYRNRAKNRRELLRAEFRQNMLKYLVTHPCVICGEADMRTLEFDHLDPSQKSFSISQAVKQGKSWSLVLLEIKKCRVLCANCHKKHTSAHAGWYKG